jgi:hypothetical protein
VGGLMPIALQIPAGGVVDGAKARRGLLAGAVTLIAVGALAGVAHDAAGGASRSSWRSRACLLGHCSGLSRWGLSVRRDSTSSWAETNPSRRRATW